MSVWHRQEHVPPHCIYRVGRKGERMVINKYSGVEHVPTCSTWPPQWLTAARPGADASPRENRRQSIPLPASDDSEMSKALAVIDEALSATWLTQSQRN